MAYSPSKFPCHDMCLTLKESGLKVLYLFILLHVFRPNLKLDIAFNNRGHMETIYIMIGWSEGGGVSEITEPCTDCASEQQYT